MVFIYCLCYVFSLVCYVLHCYMELKRDYKCMNEETEDIMGNKGYQECVADNES